MTDRRLLYWNGKLYRKVISFTRGKMMTRDLYRQTDQLVQDFVTEARGHGIGFPVPVLIWLREVGALEIVRADMTKPQLLAWIPGIRAKYPGLSPRGLVEALAEHFPDRGCMPEQSIENFVTSSKTIVGSSHCA